MYSPDHFNINDSNEALSFIAQNSFGQIISNVNGRVFSTHIPFLLGEDGKTINGHLAKQNTQWQNLSQQEVLISIQGPHGYISPSWYSSPGVPTWNYQAVHIYGQCEIIQCPDKLHKIVAGLTDKYEAGSDNPWLPEYNQAMLKAIVGFEMVITEIQCKYKLSQNRSDADRAGVIKRLKQKGGGSLAQAIENNNPR